MERTLVERIEERARARMSVEKKQSCAHRWGHVARVRRWALMLAKDYGDADIIALELAAILHDIDQPYDGKKEHARTSASLARKMLYDEGAENELIEKVARMIEEHSSEDVKSVCPTTLESKLLFDADKLDGLGAVGIARVFAYQGQHAIEPENAVGWFKRKIEISLAHMQTDKGRRIASERLSYVRDFISRFEGDTES